MKSKKPNRPQGDPVLISHDHFPHLKKAGKLDGTEWDDPLKLAKEERALQQEHLDAENKLIEKAHKATGH